MWRTTIKFFISHEQGRIFYPSSFHVSIFKSLGVCVENQSRTYHRNGIKVCQKYFEYTLNIDNISDICKFHFKIPNHWTKYHEREKMPTFEDFLHMAEVSFDFQYVFFFESTKKTYLSLQVLSQIDSYKIFTLSVYGYRKWQTMMINLSSLQEKSSGQIVIFKMGNLT
jgi:hypothetical protein